MFDEKESAVAYELYFEALNSYKSGAMPKDEIYGPLIEYHQKVTGIVETDPLKIIHHRSTIYGPPCDSCGKPYRTPKARLCAYCGGKR